MTFNMGKMNLTLVGFVILGIMGFSAVTPTAAKAQEASHDIADYVSDKLEDFTAKMVVGSFDEREGEKINKDFGYIYKLKGDVTLSYKEVNHLRVDGLVAASKFTLINNGSKQIIRSSAGLNIKTDLGTSPGKRKTLLDAGMLSKGYLAYTEAEFKRTQIVNGINCSLFRISYKDKAEDTSHRLVWIDPKTRVTIKREEYSQEGKLNCTYFYLLPKEIVPGIWFPTKITVVNKNGKEAGTTLYKDVKVNKGLDNSLFN